MDVYSTEEQQIDAIKRWWKNNGNGILIGIGLAIAVVLGWQTWHQSQQAEQQGASALYSQLVESVAVANQSLIQGETEALESQRATITHLGEQIKSEYEDTKYAVFAALMLAAQAVTADQLDAALSELVWAQEHAENEATQIIINLRRARVLAAQGQHDQALAQLESVAPQALEDRYLEAKGDIYVAMGETEKAQTAYKEAMTLSEAADGQARPILKIKHDNLLVASS